MKWGSEWCVRCRGRAAECEVVRARRRDQSTTSAVYRRGQSAGEDAHDRAARSQRSQRRAAAADQRVTVSS